MVAMGHFGRAEAQLPVTLSAGPTFISIASDDWETSSTTGFFLSAGTSLQINDRFSVDPSLAYIQKGTKFESDGSTASYNYIAIPVVVTATMPVSDRVQMGVSAGPQLGINIKCDEDGFDCSEYDNFKKTEVSLNGSVSFWLPLSEGARHLRLGAGVDHGLTNLFDELEYKTRTYYLIAGIRL
jgi:hypothetical protein